MMLLAFISSIILYIILDIYLDIILMVRIIFWDPYKMYTSWCRPIVGLIIGFVILDALLILTEIRFVKMMPMNRFHRCWWQILEIMVTGLSTCQLSQLSPGIRNNISSKNNLSIQMHLYYLWPLCIWKFCDLFYLFQGNWITCILFDAVLISREYFSFWKR